jgi:hypothetical protein
MKPLTILGFKVSLPVELARADEADYVVYMQKPTIRLLEQNIRYLSYSLLSNGLAASSSFAAHITSEIAILNTPFECELWFSLPILFFLGCLTLFFVVMFVAEWKRRGMLNDVLFLKRLTWVQSEGPDCED